MEDADTLQQMHREGARLACHSETNEGHGRVEKRACVALQKTDWFREEWHWQGLKSLVMIERHRKENKQSEFTTERHFYLTSLEADAEMLSKMIRQHWGVENSLHWVLDVTYKEDQCRARKGHAASNLSTLRKWTLNLFERSPGKASIRTKQKKAAWDHDFLVKLLHF